jgi:aspartyl-tRNA(Asn)/glutamyl-tRNA(Gln) amidotransferase subunit A
LIEMAQAGAQRPATAFIEAGGEIARMRERLSATLAEYDMIMTPSAAALPWPARQPYPPAIDGRTVDPRGHAVYAAFVNASGCAAISVPCAPSREDLPIGFQLVAAAGRDEDLCSIARAYERAAPWYERWPPL